MAAFWTKAGEGKNYKLINSPKAVSWLFNKLKTVELCAIDIETNHKTALQMAVQHDVVIGGISFSWQKNQAAYLPLYTGRGQETWWKRTDVFDAILDKLEAFLSGPCEKVGQNIKFDAAWIYRVLGIVVKNIVFDTMLAHHLLDEEGLLTCRHGLKPMAKYYIDPLADRYEKELKQALDHYDPIHRRYTEVDIEILYIYACSDADYTLQLMHIFEPMLEQQGLLDLLYETVMPLSHVCMLIEIGGMAIDMEKNAELSVTYKQRRDELTPLIYQASGFQFDIASSQQAAEVLYTRLNLPVQYGKKGQISTDKESLEKIKDLHPVVPLLGEYRSVEKLNTGYVESIRCRYNPVTRMLHPTFLIHGTVTGRLSCVAEWTRLKTQRGDVPISEMRVGDQVWTHKGRWRSVQKLITKGPGHMYDVHFSTGVVLTCTLAHRLLTQDQEWVQVGAIVDDYFKNLGRECAESSGSAGAVSRAGLSDCTADRCTLRNDTPQRLVCAEDVHAGRRTQSACEGALFSFEDRRQKPDDREDGRSTPQLDRGVRRWTRILDVHAQRQEMFCASACDGGSARIRVAGSLDGASHRWRSEEQCPGQFSRCQPRRACRYPLFTGAGLPASEVTKVHYRGSYEVYDLTVEEDQSYEACGVLSHNTEDPNVQNWPRPENGGIPIKAMFIAGEGHKICMADYSQIELRVAAHCSREAAWVSAFCNGIDVHSSTAKECYKLECSVEEVKKLFEEFRSRAKSINFGILYGMSAYGLAPRLHMTPDEAQAFIELYFSRLPTLKGWIDGVHQQAMLDGYVTNLFGRRRRLPDIQLFIPQRGGKIQGAPSCFGKRKEAPQLVKLFYPGMDFKTDMHVFSDAGRLQMLARDLVAKHKCPEKCTHCPLIASCAFEVERSYRQSLVNEAKRQSVNSLVQSAASDLAAKSFSQVLLVCKANGIPLSVDPTVPGVRPWNMIHDELLFVVADQYVEQCSRIMRDVMINIFPQCIVPLDVDLEVVDRLSDKHTKKLKKPTLAEV